MRIEFTPAGVGAYLKYWKLLENLETDTFLVNAISYDIRWKDYISELRKMKNFKILVDSGGFQTITQYGVEHNIDPIDIYNKQKSIGDIGFILDTPTFQSKQKVETDEKFFQKCLDVTKKNIKLVKKYCTKDKRMKYYFISQGSTEEHIKRWCEELIPLDEFDGIALKTTFTAEGGPKQLINSFNICKEYGFRNYHILGISAPFYACLIHYMFDTIRDKVDLVTYDSTTPNIYSRLKRYMVPLFVSKMQVIRVSDYLGEELPCNCSICRNSSFEELERPGSQETFKLMIHNANVLNNFNKLLSMLIKHKETYRFTTIKLFPELEKWYDMIDGITENKNTKTLLDF